MPKKTNIKVSRYSDELPEGARCADGTFPWEASIEPEDGAWVLFVPKDATKEPLLAIRVGEIDHGDGTGEDAYAMAGSPEHIAFLKGEKVDVSRL